MDKTIPKTGRVLSIHQPTAGNLYEVLNVDDIMAMPDPHWLCGSSWWSSGR